MAQIRNCCQVINTTIHILLLVFLGHQQLISESVEAIHFDFLNLVLEIEDKASYVGQELVPSQLQASRRP